MPSLILLKKGLVFKDNKILLLKKQGKRGKPIMWSTGRCNRRRIDDITCKQNNVQFRMVYLPWDVVEHFKTLRYCKEHELGRCKVTENCKQSWALEVQQMTNKIYIRFNFHYAIKKISVPVDELSTVQGGSLFVLYSMLYMYLSVCSLIFVYVLPKNHMHLFCMS